MQKNVLCKVGGSLLPWKKFPSQLEEFLKSLDESAILLIGGGDCVDTVRQWDRDFHLGEREAHHLAIEAMSLTTTLLTLLVKDSCLVKTSSQLETAFDKKQRPILHPACWIDQLKHDSKTELPHCWDVTSDSIALWLANEMDIEQLILLKSCPLSEEISLESASQNGLIDPHFPQLLKEIAKTKQPPRFRWHNLRTACEKQKEESLEG